MRKAKRSYGRFLKVLYPANYTFWFYCEKYFDLKIEKKDKKNIHIFFWKIEAYTVSLYSKSFVKD